MVISEHFPLSAANIFILFHILSGLQFENSSDVGAFSNTFEAELGDHIPVVKTSIAGTRAIGRLCVGNKNGLLVPWSTTDQELQYLRNSLPDNVVVQRFEEKLCALGNFVGGAMTMLLLTRIIVQAPSCREYWEDRIIFQETEELIEDVLGVGSVYTCSCWKYSVLCPTEAV
ncbi:Eukaryotic translation initiation factor 6-2-like protein, partial [Drosera capensis]